MAPRQDDPRIGDLLAKGYSVDEAQVVVVPFPHDEGVRRNGGRVGAKKGPEVFQQHIQRTGALVNVEHGVDISHLKVAVADAVAPNESSLEAAHAQLTERVGSVIARGGIPFVVGGGNDQSFPNAAALLERAGSNLVATINIDAHLDVRPLKQGKVHSGSPFRLLLEDKRFHGDMFVEFAAQGMQCSAEHADYLKSKGGSIIWLKQLHEGEGPVKEFRKVLSKFQQKDAGVKIFVSFDLDAVRGADAPGVSCPGALGLTSDDALQICFAAGECPNVALFDLSEFNPEIEPYRTGKLVAAMFYHFLMGFSRRK